MRALCFALLSLVSASFASAQELRFPAIGSDTAQAMSALAEQAIASYKQNDRDRYLDNLFRIQMVAGRNRDATASIKSLRALRRNKVSLSATAATELYAIVASAKQHDDSTPLEAAFGQAFRDVFARLDDRTSALAIRALGINRFALDRAVTAALQQQQGKESIS